jgi:hypothetical protein
MEGRKKQYGSNSGTFQRARNLCFKWSHSGST